MEGGGIDRRVAKTRRGLHQALIKLILNKDYEAISVRDIIEEADVGRATFYAHYRCKDDLLRAGFSELRELLRVAQSERREEAPFAFALALFEHACSYRNVYAALVGGRGGTIVLQQIRNVLADMVKEELRTDAEENGIPRQVMVDFVVSGCVTVMTLCLNRRVISSPDAAANIFKTLVLHGIGRHRSDDLPPKN